MAEAGKDITSGLESVMVGYQAGQNFTSGRESVFIGSQAGTSIVAQATNGRYTMVGMGAGFSSTGSSGYATYIGYNAGYNDKSTTSHHTAIGGMAGYNVSGSGDSSTFLGNSAGKGSASGMDARESVVIGGSALADAARYSNNDVFIGGRAGVGYVSGSYNIAIGHSAMREAGDDMTYVTTSNVGVGYRTNYNMGREAHSTGSVAVGYEAGYNVSGGSKNVYIGYGAGPSSAVATESNTLYIANAAGTPLIGGDFSAGTVTIDGTLSATAKSFNIEHPLYKDKRLVHGSLEGPEHGIYIRGTVEATNDCVIELPEYWSAMCDDYTVQLTGHGPYTVFIKGKYTDAVMIGCTEKDYKFDYYIVGCRMEIEVVQDG